MGCLFWKGVEKKAHPNGLRPKERKEDEPTQKRFEEEGGERMSYAHPVTHSLPFRYMAFFFFFLKPRPKKPHFWVIFRVLLGSEGVF
jgi:hypothetical protein